MYIRMSKIAAVALMISTPALADSVGGWKRDNIKGYETYWTVNSSGARFTIWCPPNHLAKNALIGIDIKGQRPKALSLVKFEIGRRLVRFSADSDGYIRTNCFSCSDNLTYFWGLMRSSAHLSVVLNDERKAGFSLNGVRDLLPRSACTSVPGQQAGR